MVQTSETVRKDNQQKAQLEEDEVTAKAKAAFAEIRAMAERGEFPEMTLDEINEEIREVRRLRKNVKNYTYFLESTLFLETIYILSI